MLFAGICENSLTVSFLLSAEYGAFYGYGKQVRKMRIKVYFTEQPFVLADHDAVELASLVSGVYMY